MVAYVPHPMVKDILVQKECNGTRGRWITKIQEYDIEVKPTKLIKGQDLEKMIAESSLGTMDELSLEEHVNSLFSSLEQVWYSNIIYYLKNVSCHSNMN